MGRRRRLDNKAWNRIERDRKLWSRDFQRQCGSLPGKATSRSLGVVAVGVEEQFFKLLRNFSTDRLCKLVDDFKGPPRTPPTDGQ